MATAPDPRWVDADGKTIDEEDRGLVYDVRTLIDRRKALGLFGLATAAGLLAACTPTTPGSSASPTTGSGTNGGSGGGGAVAEVPDETTGPFPGDGTNGPNVLDDSGIVRRDIRSSFGSSTTTADGVPMTFSLTVRGAATGDVLSGAAVYAWHCDAVGGYSLYSPGLAGENYLRGVQEVDASGTATFESIFPGCYPGRWPHIHFEVYPSLADAIASGPIVKTSQIALPKEVSEAAYATAAYGASAGNLRRLSLATDNVFRDDGALRQLATVTGDAASGYTATLTIGV